MAPSTSESALNLLCLVGRESNLSNSTLTSYSDSEPTDTSLDCLQINVVVPNTPKPEGGLRPVVVWIHGGGYLIMSSHNTLYNMSKMVHATDAIGVSFNYRLGVEALVAHPLLTQEDPSHRSSGAYGFEDQVFALQWVQRNIQKFGGDPKQVTIYGESAGGGAVVYHLFSPKSKGLFQGAIAASPVISNPLPNLSHAEKFRGDKLEKLFGPFKSADDIRKIPYEKLQEALDLAVIRLVDAGVPTPVEESDFYLRNGWTADGINFPFDFDVLKLTKEGKYHEGVRVIIGTCQSELTILFARFMLGFSDQLFSNILTETYGESAKEIEKVLLDSKRDEQLWQSLSRQSANTFFVCPTHIFAREMAKNGGDVRTYQWRAFPAGGPTSVFGAHHMIDVLYAFSYPSGFAGTAFSEEDEKVAKNHWALLKQFLWGKKEIIYDVNSGSTWPKYNPTDEPTLLIDSKFEVTRFTEAKPCNSLESIFAREKSNFHREFVIPWENEPLFHKVLNVIGIPFLTNVKWTGPTLLVVVLLVLRKCCCSSRGSSVKTNNKMKKK